MSDDLPRIPASWKWTKLGEIAEIKGGLAKGKKRKTGERLIEVPYLRVANVQRGYLDLRVVKKIQATSDEVKLLTLRTGDVLFNEGGDRDKLGRGWVWNGEIPVCIHQNHVFRARVDDRVMHPRLLSWWGNSGGSQYFIDEGKQTTNLASINLGKLRSFPVPVPPPEDQPHIVQALDSYFSRLDDTVATLERVQRNLKRYRASVLKAAVEGRLVPTEAELARAEGRSYEPASVLLERILEERRRRWRESGKKGRYKEPVAPDVGGLPGLPEGWCWATSDMLTWDSGYGTSQKCTYESDGPPVLRIPNVQNESLSLDDLKFATGADKLKADGVVRPGDFLFIRTNGSKSLIGRGAVVVEDPPQDHHFASYLIRLRLARVKSVPQWFGVAWHSPIVRNQLLKDAASSAGQHNVSLTAAKQYMIPLPPGAEQLRVLSELERSRSIASAAMVEARASADRCSRLRQSVLKWAFEGKLVVPAPTLDSVPSLSDCPAGLPAGSGDLTPPAYGPHA